MRALVITGPGSARVEDVEVPVPGAGQIVVDVRQAGICGTDVELLTGQLAYFAQGKTAIEHYADGRVDPAGIVQVTVGLEHAAEALAGKISPGAGTKIHIDPCA